MRAEAAFTARAVAIGAAVGAVGAVSNLYVSLKTGWSLPVMTTAAVVGLGVARAQRRALGAPEAVVLTSLASAAAFLTGGGNAAAIPALVMLGGAAPDVLVMIAWFASTAVLGTLAAPLLGKRVHELGFPTATATATLLASAGGGEGTTRALWRSASLAALAAALRTALRVPATLLAPGGAGAYTFGVDTSLLLVGVGGLMARRTAISTLVGGVVTYGVIAPRIAGETGFRAIVQVMVWPAAALLVASSVVELALDLPRIARGGDGSTKASRRGGLLLAPAAAATAIAHFALGLSWLVAIGALAVAFALAYVAARAMGETDIVPTRALAPLAQGLFGLAERGLLAPTMAPNLTGAVALHAADTVACTRVSTLLGVRQGPRLAIAARVVGVLLGAIVVAVAYAAIVPDARALPSAELPAPGVLVWKAVAEVVASGALPPLTRAAIAYGAAAGAALALVDRAAPARLKAWLPSAMGIGSGMVLPASSSLAIALGALFRHALESRRSPEEAVATSSGLVAGESVVGVVSQLVR